MKMYRLGLVSPEESQAIYHVLAREGIESLTILSPSRKYVCVGYFQDAGRCVDLEYCGAEGIPVIRREVGGGVVLLDENQVFYQLVLKKDNPILPAGVAAMFATFSAPPVNTYRRLGVDCAHKAVNDIVTPDGRKVSGQGGADIGQSQVFVGNIIIDFDYDTMVRALRVPDEKFRDKIHKSMRDNLTTLKRELPEPPSREAVEDILIEEFERILGPLEPSALPREVLERVGPMGERLASESFVMSGGKRPRGVTIREGLKVGRADYKAPGGLISAEVEVLSGTIASLALTGDFTFRPRDAWDSLAPSLTGIPVSRPVIERAIGSFYRSKGADSPGVTSSDIATAILKAAE